MIAHVGSHMLIFKGSLFFLASVVFASDFISKENSNSDVQEFSGSQSDRSCTKKFMKQSSDSHSGSDYGFYSGSSCAYASGSDSDYGYYSGSSCASGSDSDFDYGYYSYSDSDSSVYVDFDHDENLLVLSKVDEYLKMAEINKEEAVLKANTEFDEIKKAFIEAEANFQKTTDDSVEAKKNVLRINASDRKNEPEYNKRLESKYILDSNTKMQETEDKLKKAKDSFDLLEKDYKLISKVHRQFLLTLDYNDLVDKNQRLCELDNMDRNEIMADIDSPKRIDHDLMIWDVGKAEKLSKKIAKYTEIMRKKGKEEAVLKVDRDFKSVQNKLSQLEVNLLFEYGYYRLISMKCEENGSIHKELENLRETAESLKPNSKTSADVDEKLIEIETVAIPKLEKILHKSRRNFNEAKFKVSNAENDYKSALENYFITFEARLEFLKSLEEDKVSVSSATAESF